jgi:hypothetical protein
MSSKTSQLQIRVSPEQKRALKLLAERAGLSTSAYVLSIALPGGSPEFTRRVQALSAGRDRPNALSDLGFYLAAIPPETFLRAISEVDFGKLSPLLRNYAAAAVEQECARRRAPIPSWATDVEPPARPHFAWELRSLRPHLTRVSPPAFKRRNLFVPSPQDERR